MLKTSGDAVGALLGPGKKTFYKTLIVHEISLRDEVYFEQDLLHTPITSAYEIWVVSRAPMITHLHVFDDGFSVPIMHTDSTLEWFDENMHSFLPTTNAKRSLQEISPEAPLRLVQLFRFRLDRSCEFILQEMQTSFMDLWLQLQTSHLQGLVIFFMSLLRIWLALRQGLQTERLVARRQEHFAQQHVLVSSSKYETVCMALLSIE